MTFITFHYSHFCFFEKKSRSDSKGITPLSYKYRRFSYPLVPIRKSSLDRAGSHAGDDILLQEDIENQNRQHRQQQRRHDQPDIRRIRSVERLRRDGQRIQLLPAKNETGEKVVVPKRHCVNNRHGRDRRFQQRKNDPPERLPPGTAVDLRR